MKSSKMNVVFVMTDTLRTAYLGCYGNKTIRTPNIDRFCQVATRFTRAYPESLPTIPVRRAIHTGRRAYPFRDYKPVKWDIVYQPGWQPISNDEDTVAENLAAAGYHTGFVTDALPYFAPGFNFYRGFWQWEYIRGKQQDRWKSVHTVTEEEIRRFGDPAQFLTGKRRYGSYPYNCANTRWYQREEDTCTARTFRWAMQFLEDNAKAEPFYLYVDSFSPHEPWEAPKEYYRLYADPNYAGFTQPHVMYAPRSEQALLEGWDPIMSDAQLGNIIANYSGMVTQVDTWFGKLLDKLEALGLADNTVIVFTSDHGTNFADNPWEIIGKPHYSMWPGVMHLPLIVRWPGATPGQSVDALVSNVDITASVYDACGADNHEAIDGRSLRPLLAGEGSWENRPYITCRFDDSLCYIDDKHWVRTNIEQEPGELFDLQADPLCKSPLDWESHPEITQRAWEQLLSDAGGQFPAYDKEAYRRTDAVGEKAEERKR